MHCVSLADELNGVEVCGVAVRFSIFQPCARRGKLLLLTTVHGVMKSS